MDYFALSQITPQIDTHVHIFCYDHPLKSVFMLVRLQKMTCVEVRLYSCRENIQPMCKIRGQCKVVRQKSAPHWIGSSPCLAVVRAAR